MSEAEAGDDPTSITPTSKISSVASAPVAAYGEESTEDHMFNDKAKKLLEAALKQPLEDLADDKDDPLDIQGKMFEAAKRNTEEIRRNKRVQFAEETVAKPKGAKAAKTDPRPAQSASSSTGNYGCSRFGIHFRGRK